MPDPIHVNLVGRWRVGRKVGRTIYAQQGSEPSNDDPLIGVMDYPLLAALAVEGHNNNASLPYDREKLMDAVVYHWRDDIKGCGCGWSKLGASHAAHVADVYEESVRRGR